METIISLIPNDEHVAATRQELETAGFDKDKIDILYQPADVWQRLGGHQKIHICMSCSCDSSAKVRSWRRSAVILPCESLGW